MIDSAPELDDARPAQRGVAVITGAASGIGRAIAIELAARGLFIVGVDLKPDELEATIATVERNGGRGYAIQMDVADSTRWTHVAATAQRVGGATVLVNNAAVYPSGPWDAIDEGEWDRVLAVNLKAAFLSSRALIDQLRAAPGSIVNIASNTFFGGFEGLAHYVSSKGGVIGLTRALARELGHDGVRVNAVAPGAIPTAAESIHSNPAQYSEWVIRQQSLKRRGSPEEIARAVAFFAGPDSSFVTGQTLVVDGGWRLH